MQCQEAKHAFFFLLEYTLAGKGIKFQSKTKKRNVEKNILSFSPNQFDYVPLLPSKEMFI